MSTTRTSLIEIILYPDSILKSHTYSYTILSIYYNKALIFACPLEDIRLSLILVGEDEHLSSSTFAKLDGLNQECTKFVSFVFFYQDNSWLYSF